MICLGWLGMLSLFWMIVENDIKIDVQHGFLIGKDKTEDEAKIYIFSFVKMTFMID